MHFPFELTGLQIHGVSGHEQFQLINNHTFSYTESSAHTSHLNEYFYCDSNADGAALVHPAYAQDPTSPCLTKVEVIQPYTTVVSSVAPQAAFSNFEPLSSNLEVHQSVA